jgi:hypothetical protein
MAGVEEVKDMAEMEVMTGVKGMENTIGKKGGQHYNADYIR